MSPGVGRWHRKRARLRDTGGPSLAAKDSGFPSFRLERPARTLHRIGEFAAEQHISGTDTTAAERGAAVARLAAWQGTGEGTPVEFVRATLRSAAAMIEIPI